MRHRLRKQLEAKNNRLIADALSGAISSDETPKLKEKLERIETYSKLLSLSDSRWAHDWAVAAVVALLCLSAAAYLWHAKVPRTNVSLVVETRTVHGDLAKDWKIQSPFQSKEMHFENFSSVDDPNLGLSINSKNGNGWFRLEGGQIELQSLRLEKGAQVEIVSEGDQVGLLVGSKPLTGFVTVMGKGIVTAGMRPGENSLRRRYDLKDPEMVEFSVNDPRAVQSRLTIHSPGSWALASAPFRNVSFVTQEDRGVIENELSSGIKSGSLHFNDTSWPVMELAENELLAIHQTQDARIEARSGSPSIHMTLNGFVKEVTVGDSETGRKLAPSYLEYYFSKKTLSFFWGAILLLWGVLWGIRKTIFR